MPQVEAAGCGIPLASINYSAMSDVVEKTNGFPLKTDRMFYEWETNAFRAYPDNNYTADTIYKFFCRDDKYKQTKSKQASNAAKKYFCWDRSAKIWSDHFESIILKNQQGLWESKGILTNFHIAPYNEYPNMTNTQFVEWLCVNVAKDPSLFFKPFGLEAIQQLNVGLTSPFKGGSPINRESMYNMFKNIGNNKIICEQARLNPELIGPSDFIEFAHEFERGLK